ncbi:MAG: hypothetical protein NTW21_09995 [Verrucomicrobia bacterium]|nr:hypothetical protein [Verrucomicrobiota bacterium]
MDEWETASPGPLMVQGAGLAAIIVYPMNALANDPQRRINDLPEATGVADLVNVRKYDRGTRQPERERMRTEPPHRLLTDHMMSRS